MDETKKPWQSKTLWANAIVAVAAFFPPATSWISQNPEGFSLVLGGLNMLLRVVSEKKVTFTKEF